MAGPGQGPGQRAGLTAEQEAAWFAYMRVVLRLDYELNHQLSRDHDLSLADFDVLNALADSPDGRLQVSALGVRIGWERSRVSHRLRRMEARGLVARERSATDGRATVAALTESGAAAVAAATPSHAALVKRLFFDGLPARLVAPLTEAMDAVHEQLVAEGSLPRPPGRQTRWA
ncbi:MarR family transcriptional regulator [Nocardioides anomalus]|uniref:MarR family transcriptional regulator n=1 Tax=Nocardioides anomalus TaxID=2712223 RepID=A0A6G6W8Y0_9ACTN|nr:MarR family transcriptional regulator [Nocardioides anomalus]QIG41676.1 MarR family transcriptional regulator [Nocardioides anomalus]